MKLRTRFLVVMLTAAVTVMASGSQSIAVHDLDVFELDGNIANPSGGGDDWVTLYNDGGSSELLEFTHVADGDSPTDVTYLHQGGSKDVNDISEWLLTSNDEAPDKDEIINAFGAAYLHEGDLIVYFAADRFSNDGDAQIGFWFVQDDVTIANGDISGSHTLGDVLVLSDFVNGGSVPNIRVFEWVGGKNPLNEIADPANADCATAASDDDTCAIVNDAILTGLPWSYTPKGNIGSSVTYPIGTFYEGGVNLTELGVAADCFSTFLAETRTSAALDARLKDIAVGDFNTCATKSGTKFEDLNGDGDRDSGEPGLSGWDIHLFGQDDQSNAVHLHDTTDSNGDYAFEALEPGQYTVCETQKSGWSQSMPGSGTGTTSCSGHTHGGTTPGARGYAIDLDFGEDDSGNDFGNFRQASKSGTKFEDLDADGVHDSGEPGVSDVTIHLFGTDGLGNSVHVHDTTDSNGDYSFTVNPGSYTVCEGVPSGWTQSAPGSGGTGIVSCAEHDGASGLGYAITLASNDADTGNDFGNYRNATKSGTKFEDLDGDGVFDAGEPGLPGWEIHIFDAATGGDVVHQHATTDGDGDYSFSVPPGSYTVCETQPTGWSQSMPGTGTGTASCSAHTHDDAITPGARGYAVTFTSGGSESDNDFGNFRQASASGAKFEDLNADGDRDAGEDGLEGWEIHLFGTDGQGTTVHEHDSTDADGDYSFTVAPGSYTVCETIPSAWTQSAPSSGADCSAHGGGFGYAITLVSNDADNGNDFGNFQRSSVEGLKFNDLDGDGARDEGEPALAGWEITLYGTSGQGGEVLETATTDADGTYSFIVPPGSYLVCETQQGDASATPAIGVDMTADPISGTPGAPVTYTYVITNEGGVDLTNVIVVDDVLGQIGDPIASLPVGASVTRTVSTTMPTTAGGLTSTVDVTATADWVQTAPATGPSCTTHGGGIAHAITPVSGETVSDVDFGNQQRTASASDAETIAVVLAAIIPKTGTDARLMTQLGFSLLGLGVVLAGISRRRRRLVPEEVETA